MIVSPIIAATLAAAAGAALAKVVVNEWRRVNAVLHPQEPATVREPAERQPLPTLRRDPRTGIYRPD